MLLKFLFQLWYIHPTGMLYFFRIRGWITVRKPYKNMIILMFNEVVFHRRMVQDTKYFLDIALHAPPKRQTLYSTAFNIFALLWVGATGIGPKPCAVVRLGSTLLKQQWSGAVKYEKRKCTMQHPLLVSCHFVHDPQGVIFRVDQKYFVSLHNNMFESVS